MAPNTVVADGVGNDIPGTNDVEDGDEPSTDGDAVDDSVPVLVDDDNVAEFGVMVPLILLLLLPISVNESTDDDFATNRLSRSRSRSDGVGVVLMVAAAIAA